MTNAEMKRFLSQFQKATDKVHNWPRWMFEQRHQRAATFPAAKVPAKQKGGAT